MYTSCLAYIAVTKQQVRVRRHPLHLAPSLLALGVAYLPAITEAGAGVTARPKIAHNFYSVQKRNALTLSSHLDKTTIPSSYVIF